MHVLGMNKVPDDLRDRLTEKLAARGTVGIIQSDEGAINGEWVLTTQGADAREFLDVLAPRCDFALVDERIDVGSHLTVEDGIAHSNLLDQPLPIDEVNVMAMIDTLVESEPYVTLESLVAQIKSHENEVLSGAIATFTGRVRVKESSEDTETEYLEFEQYGDIAWERMEKIREELREREEVYEVLMHHRTGVVHGGEDIVFVVVLAGHREQAFRTVKDGINRLKAEVPIFKKEVTVDEEFWVHNRP